VTYHRRPVAYRSPAQRLRVQRLESLLRLTSPGLNLVLYLGDKASRVAGRKELPPEPPRRQALPK
jgi:hypothetical protein